MLLKKRISQLGFKAITAKNGVQALQKIKKDKPDLILLDLLMPKKDGFEVLEALRKRKGTPIPVIILSNLNHSTDIARGKELGAVDYLVKSNISLRELMELIQNYVLSMK